MSPKRTRSDSVTAHVKALQNAAKDTIPPPDYIALDKSALDFWHANIRSKALDSWTSADLIAAAELANNQSYAIELRKELKKEEKVKGEERNELAINALRKHIIELQRTVLAQRRDLQIHSHATNGESRDQRKRNQNDTKARNTVNELTQDNGGDSLIAVPRH